MSCEVQRHDKPSQRNSQNEHFILAPQLFEEEPQEADQVDHIARISKRHNYGENHLTQLSGEV